MSRARTQFVLRDGIQGRLNHFGGLKRIKNSRPLFYKKKKKKKKKKHYLKKTLLYPGLGPTK
ncbi:hypothetical protein HanXRQr2_Chr15g0672241 [Helianthus annuus]|uniref:Uncharacterized protein n=1 Tax=Helianthus annuus TaxID=4232 RepID=A0A9K3DYN2_HELAN|nr:hypothetical protein HanXRQr2_Chr15g0672241 [Helianthus annuus]